MANQDFTEQEFQEEEWRPVVGFEAFYAVSSLGRVRRIMGGPGAQSDRIIWGGIVRNGYRRVGFYTGARKVAACMNVHRVVALTFLGLPPPGQPQVNHKDGCKLNNRLNNLEWNSAKEDGAHRVRMGLTPTGDRSGAHTHPERVARGERHGSKTKPDRVPRGDRSGSRTRPESRPRGIGHHRTKFTESDIEMIRTRYLSGEGLSVLGRAYGVSAHCIHSIVHRRTWRHVP